jgi:hypothetical protein
LNLNSLDILLTDEEHFEHNDFASKFFPDHKRKDIREFQDFCTKNIPSKILELTLVRIVFSGTAIERAYYISKIEDVLEDGLSQNLLIIRAVLREVERYLNIINRKNKKLLGS